MLQQVRGLQGSGTSDECSASGQPHNQYWGIQVLDPPVLVVRLSKSAFHSAKSFEILKAGVYLKFGGKMEKNFSLEYTSFTIYLSIDK